MISILVVIAETGLYDDGICTLLGRRGLAGLTCFNSIATYQKSPLIIIARAISHTGIKTIAKLIIACIL